MIIIGIVLSFAGFAYLCWLLFALAVHALPFFAGVTVGFAAYHSGSGPAAAIIIGAIAGGFLFSLVGAAGVTGFNLWSMFVAIVGAVVVLLLYHAISGRSRV